ncbi:MAG: geranylfarnesyl diphosphate synthase [Halobacteriaceae archaeon]
MNPETREEVVLNVIKERREQINEAIETELPMAEPEKLYEASRALLIAGGKRLRPAMLLLTAEALADIEPLSEPYREFPTLANNRIDIMAAAVSIEVIHSFTLIHDDIMDDDDMRRGVPAIHRQYDTETAILAGDTLYSKAFEIMLRTEAKPDNILESIDLLARTCTHICEGQAMDVSFESQNSVLPDDYIEMIELKTAVLYAAAASVPAVIMDADSEVIDSLYQYGLCVGQAFQIQDDVLDLTVPSEQLGKQRGSDLVEDKQTLITLHAKNNGVNVDELIDADHIDEVDDQDIDEAVARLREVGSIEYAKNMAQDLTEKGKQHLINIPDNEARDKLHLLADYLIERGY